jgi:Domain of unknown function (DUF6265)
VLANVRRFSPQLIPTPLIMSPPTRSIICRALLLVTVSAPTLTAQASSNIAQLSWMAGCWEQRSATRVTEEQWMAAAGGTMLGVSRTIARDSTRGYEFMRIATLAGKLTYIAQPSGQAETAFVTSAITDTLAVFENPAHDFPQRIEYRRVTADSIVARISATTRSGQARGMEIPMRRSRCGG